MWSTSLLSLLLCVLGLIVEGSAYIATQDINSDPQCDGPGNRCLAFERPQGDSQDARLERIHGNGQYDKKKLRNLDHMFDYDPEQLRAKFALPKDVSKKTQDFADVIHIRRFIKAFANRLEKIPHKEGSIVFSLLLSKEDIAKIKSCATSFENIEDVYTVLNRAVEEMTINDNYDVPDNSKIIYIGMLCISVFSLVMLYFTARHISASFSLARAVWLSVWIVIVLGVCWEWQRMHSTEVIEAEYNALKDKPLRCRPDDQYFFHRMYFSMFGSDAVCMEDYKSRRVPPVLKANPFVATIQMATAVILYPFKQFAFAFDEIAELYTSKHYFYVYIPLFAALIFLFVCVLYILLVKRPQALSHDGFHHQLATAMQQAVVQGVVAAFERTANVGRNRIEAVPPPQTGELCHHPNTEKPALEGRTRSTKESSVQTSRDEKAVQTKQNEDQRCAQAYFTDLTELQTQSFVTEDVETNSEASTKVEVPKEVNHQPSTSSSDTAGLCKESKSDVGVGDWQLVDKADAHNESAK